MFSKEESAKLREEFWTSFGKSFPKKWILYNTKIKDVSFKFHFDTKKAMVSMDIECVEEKRQFYYDKMLSLRSILEETIPEVIFDADFQLENGKNISKIYLQKDKVCIHNKQTWQETMLFLYDNMLKFEDFWLEYEDFIKE